MLLRQLFDPSSSTYTYLLAYLASGQALIIDSVYEQAERDMHQLERLGLRLHYSLDTHIHADHVTGASALKQKTGCHIAYPADPEIQGADLLLEEGTQIQVGSITLKVLSVPGHTAYHVAFYCPEAKMLFTGDTLLINGCGRCDFQGGDAGMLYDGITEKLFTLPEDTIVYPGHNYHGITASTIGEEKRCNPRFQSGRTGFIKIMDNLNLPNPKQIDRAVPANQQLGQL